MPLILLTGYPCSGKTLRANQLKNFFSNVKNIEAIIVDDSLQLNKNLLYADSQKEKLSRSSLKSAIQRLISKDSLIICDSPNYIKGFRYELFCIVKAAQTTKCLVQCHATPDQVHIYNKQRPEEDRYNEAILDELIQRYEAPDPNNKWDFPLFNAHSSVVDSGVESSKSQLLLADTPELPYDDIYDSLYSTKPLPPNLSTLPQALSSTNFLNELDSITQHVAQEYIAEQRHHPSGEPVPLTICCSPTNQTTGAVGASDLSRHQRTLADCDSNNSIELIGNVPSAEIFKLRRQFINFTRQHPPACESGDAVRRLFVRFLKERLSH